MPVHGASAAAPEPFAGGLLLKRRIATALVVAPVVVAGVVLLPVGPFALFVALLAAPGLYEWAGLSGFGSVGARLAYTVGWRGGPRAPLDGPGGMAVRAGPGGAVLGCRRGGSS